MHRPMQSETTTTVLPGVARLVSAAAVVTTCVLTTAVPTSPASVQEGFKSPDDAATGLVIAARSGDRAGLLTILGAHGTDIVSSGDPVADTETRERFVDAYEKKHQVALSGDRAVVVIGNEDFPFPIPIVRRGALWHFDTDAGRREILYRRIGRNELDVIQSCLAYVDAQAEYADKDHGAGAGVYAQRIVSQPGKQDGLYWPAEGENQSPLGELVASASADGYRIGHGRAPFHGYYYKILTKQGAAASGGALDYIAQGKMIGGFALVAYPAQYGNSGVMTFLVNHNGTIFQKDLGPRTAELAAHMTSFNPDDSWTPVVVDDLAN